MGPINHRQQVEYFDFKYIVCGYAVQSPRPSADKEQNTYLIELSNSAILCHTEINKRVRPI